MADKHAIIIAHRGESFDAPENTLSAIQLAWERDADAIEIDIQLSKDNQIVVIHDTNTRRTGGKCKKVRNQTLAELKKLDFGSYKGTKWENEKIPTLREVLNTIPSEKKLIIEIKSNYKIIKVLKNDILNSKLNNKQIEIIGFNLSTISLAKKELPDYNIFWLIDQSNNCLTRIFSPSADKLISLSLDNKLNGLDVRANKIMDQQFVNRVKSAGLKIYAWTINDPEKAKHLLNIGINGITTDRAKWLKEKIVKSK